MPQLAQVIVELFGTRAGLLRTLAFEVNSLQEDTEEAATFVLERGIGTLISYLQHQIYEGRLRKMAPLVALQAFFGPLFIHILTRSLAERGLGLALPVDEVAAQFVTLWLRAMRPEGSSMTEQQYETSEGDGEQTM